MSAFVDSAHGGYNFPRVHARYFLRMGNPLDMLDLAMVMDGCTGFRRCIAGDAWGPNSSALLRALGKLAQ